MLREVGQQLVCRVIAVSDTAAVVKHSQLQHASRSAVHAGGHLMTRITQQWPWASDASSAEATSSCYHAYGHKVLRCGAGADADAAA